MTWTTSPRRTSRSKQAAAEESGLSNREMTESYEKRRGERSVVDTAREEERIEGQDGTQLGIALKLDGPAHLATGIAAMNIPPPLGTQ
jgi:hypothetical protein